MLSALLPGAPFIRSVLAEEEKASQEALTNTDIVKMTLAGVATEEILLRIRRIPARYDLDTEMQQELRRAGVDRSIIKAMLQAMETGRPRRVRPPIEQSPKGFIEVVFDNDPEKSPGVNSILIPSKVGKPGSLRHAESITLGFAVTCSDPIHVPDAWQYISPLGSSFRRHRMLFFQESTVPGTEKKEKDLVYLEHPDRWRFQVDAGIHRGALAVVGRPGWAEKFSLLAGDEFTDITVSPGMLTRFYVKMRSLTPRERQKMDEKLVSVLPDSFKNITEGAGRRARYVPLVAITKIDVPVELEPEDFSDPNPVDSGKTTADPD